VGRQLFDLRGLLGRQPAEAVQGVDTQADEVVLRVTTRRGLLSPTVVLPADAATAKPVFPVPDFKPA